MARYNPYRFQPRYGGSGADDNGGWGPNPPGGGWPPPWLGMGIGALAQQYFANKAMGRLPTLPSIPLGAWQPLLQSAAKTLSTVGGWGGTGPQWPTFTPAQTPPGIVKPGPITTPDSERQQLEAEGVLPSLAQKQQALPSGTSPQSTQTNNSGAGGLREQLSPEDRDWYERFTQEHNGITPEQYGWGTPEENLRQNLQDRALQEAYVLAHGPDYMRAQALANRTSWLMPPDRWRTALYLRGALGREPTVAEIDAAWSRANGFTAPSGFGAGGYFQNIVPWFGPYTRWLPQR